MLGITYFRNFITNLNKIVLYHGGISGIGMKFLQILQKIVCSVICRKIQDKQHLTNIFHRVGKLKIPA